MLQPTKAIVLRSIKYGDTSLISTLFTEKQGIQTYIIQGVRSSKAKSNKAALLQPATLLDIVVYHKPNTKLQRIKEFQFAYLYTSIQQEVVKNSIALFSAELLLRLLPEQAQQPELFTFSFYYFQQLDKASINTVANYPLYFAIECSRLLGYEIRGSYTEGTPYLDMHEGAFTDHPPVIPTLLQREDEQALSELLKINELANANNVPMRSETRYRLLDWYVEFLGRHTQHMGGIRSLAVLRAILH